MILHKRIKVWLDKFQAGTKFKCTDNPNEDNYFEIPKEREFRIFSSETIFIEVLLKNKKELIDTVWICIYDPNVNITSKTIIFI